MKIAFMFSGQGAQKVGMGKDLYEKFDIAKNAYNRADEELDFSVKDVCFEENELLNNTEYTQPCLLTTSIAILNILKAKNIKADYMLGLSLGEYTALVGSNAIDLETGVKLVNNRGKFMNDAVKDLGETGMYAVIGLSETEILEMINKVKKLGTIEISNYNTKGQIVVAGEIKPLLKFEDLVKQKGKKTVKLNVSGPFHTSLLEKASENLKKELSEIEFENMDCPVITNLTGLPIKDKSEIKNILERQVKEPVKWQQSIEYLIKQDVDTFVEIGPSKILSGFVKKISRKVKVLNIEDIETFNEAVDYLKGE